MKIILTVLLIFLIVFVQAEVFGTPETICPEPIVCDAPEETTDKYSPVTIGAIAVFAVITGGMIGPLIKKHGKNLFRKRKKKGVLDLDNKKPTDQMFEDASKALEETKDEESPKGTRFRW